MNSIQGAAGCVPNMSMGSARAGSIARRTIAALIAAIALIGSGGTQAFATPVNAVVNGSFEQSAPGVNTGGFYGWTVSKVAGSFPGTGPQIITTDGITKGPYGDAIISDNAQSPYPNPDKGGNSAVYFVDDKANKSITKSFWLAAGTYEVGFDLYATASGYQNINGALFSASILGAVVTTGDVSKYPKATWQHFSANATIQVAVYYTASFAFLSGAVPAKDIVVDNVYVINQTTQSGGGAVIPVATPEPGSGALFALGLIGLGAGAKRRRMLAHGLYGTSLLAG